MSAEESPGVVRFMFRAMEMAFEARERIEAKQVEAPATVEEVRCECGGELYLLERLSVARGRLMYRCRKCSGLSDPRDWKA